VRERCTGGAFLVLAAIGAREAVLAADDWKPPEAAVSLEAYEAQYPNRTATAAALEIVGLAAKLGVDARPDSPALEDLDAETVAASEQARSAATDYVHRELANPSDAVGKPPKIVARFMDENQATLSALVAVASGRRGIEWDLDVSRGASTTMPNWAGLTSLQRLLACHTLMHLRRTDSDSALEAIEGIWRIARSLSARPDLLSQLMAMQHARLAAGLLRKARAPAYGWEARLREGQFFQGFLAAFQNDPWPSAYDPALAEQAETLARIYRRFADGLIERSGCGWTREDLQHSWDVAVSGEPDTEQMAANILPASLFGFLLRSYRLLLDSELTALILEARAERAASRENQWPARLLNLESTVCPGSFYAYRASGGGVWLAYEGSAPSGGDIGLVLPLSFRAAPPPTPTPTATPASTPTPRPH
jgi:hypothetical protein